MKIGVDIRVFMDNEYSGVSWYALFLLREILKQDRTNEYFLYYNSGHNIASRISELGFQNSDNVKIIATHYPNKFFNYFLQKIFHWPKLNVIAAKSPLLSKEGSGGGLPAPSEVEGDIFWSPHFNFSSFSKNCKMILTVHDLSFLAYPEFFSARKNFWHRMMGAKKLLARADKIIAISENTKADLIKIAKVPAQKIKVIYSGVSAEFRPLRRSSDTETAARPKLVGTQYLACQSTGAEDDGTQGIAYPRTIARLREVKEKYGLPDKFILNIGTIEPRKNIAGLIKAFDKIADQPELKDYFLVIAGSIGWKNKEIYKAISSAKNKERIKMIGYIEEGERVNFYNLATIFCYPSFYEGFGLPILEAMASGVPVITSNVSAMPEVAGDAAILIDPNDINSLAEALKQLAGDENLRQTFREKGLLQTKKFSWKKSAEEYLKIFLN
jgi:glycosyltransferase involved in cell wall biosynthesis